jgi:hypothetical protein
MGYSFDQYTPRGLDILSPITPDIDPDTTHMTFLKSVYHVLVSSQSTVFSGLLFISNRGKFKLSRHSIAEIKPELIKSGDHHGRFKRRNNQKTYGSTGRAD